MRIHAIQTGLVQIKPSQIEGRRHGLARQLAPIFDRAWSGWLPTYAWAIEHPEGVILVDTGATAALERLPKWHPYFQLAVRFDIEPEQELGPQLRALGIGANDVRQVVLTHLHVDHDAGLGYFPDSEILVRPGEIARASGALGRIRGYLPDRWPRWLDPQPLDLTAEPYGPFGRSRRLTARGDVVAVATPGHTPDHISVIVEDGDTAIFLAGDTSYTERTMLDGRVDGVSPNERDAAAPSRRSAASPPRARPSICRRTTRRRRDGWTGGRSCQSSRAVEVRPLNRTAPPRGSSLPIRA